VSDVFFKVYTNSASFHGKTDAEFSSYLRTVAYRRIVDEFRSHQENVDLEDVQEVIGVEEEHSKKIDATNSIQEVLKYLDTLPRRQKDIVLMAVWDELSYKEIANICGITEANCRQIVSRTLRQIEANVVFLLGLFFIFYR